MIFKKSSAEIAEKRDNGYLGQLIRKESELFELLPLDKQDEMEWLFGPGYRYSSSQWGDEPLPEDIDTFSRPVEDMLNDITTEDIVNNKLKNISVRMTKGACVALVFNKPGIKALKKEGYLVDVAYLRKEVEQITKCQRTNILG